MQILLTAGNSPLCLSRPPFKYKYNGIIMQIQIDLKYNAYTNTTQWKYDTVKYCTQKPIPKNLLKSRKGSSGISWVHIKKFHFQDISILSTSMSLAYLKVQCIQGTISYQKWATMKARPALTALMAILNVGGIINWKWAKQRLSRIHPYI